MLITATWFQNVGLAERTISKVIHACQVDNGLNMRLQLDEMSYCRQIRGSICGSAIAGSR
jgi:hypothetical protein